MTFNITEDGKEFKCDLSEAELNLAEKNPESFKNYLDYQTKFREDFLADIREQQKREHELMMHQNELKCADLKNQREYYVKLLNIWKMLGNDIDTTKLDIEKTKEN